MTMSLVGYYPGEGFVSVSVTGPECALDCRHCGGFYLRSMTPVRGKDELMGKAMELQARGMKGMLISGGSDDKGRVPLESYIEAMAGIKAETNLKVNVHTGIIYSGDMPRKLKKAGVDAVSFDLVGSPSVVNDVYGLEVEANTYEKALNYLTGAGLNVYPHINIGLEGGKVGHEFKAIDIIRDLGPGAVGGVVFIVLIPTPGTGMELCKPPGLGDVEKVFDYSAHRLPGTKRILGCMRPKRNKEYNLGVEKAAFRSGIKHVVTPSRYLRALAEKKGDKSEKRLTCCVL